MGLFGKRRVRDSVEYGWVRGDGWQLLQQRMRDAIENDGFVFVLVVGERGKGKSTLALNMITRIYGDRETAKRAIIFTPDDYDSLVQRSDLAELRAEDGRVKAILWDDIGLHFSTYQWFTPHHRQRMVEFLENFQTVREDVAVIIGTAVEAEMLPPKLRSAANLLIDVQRRGRAKLFGYTRYLWLRKWKVIGELEWGPADPELYRYYKRMKRLAHRAKEKARIISRTKLAKVYADLLMSLSEIDLELLYGLGIVDKDGQLTPFGEYVLKKAGLEPEELLERLSEE